jgi:hypothetical protein
MKGSEGGVFNWEWDKENLKCHVHVSDELRDPVSSGLAPKFSFKKKNHADRSIQRLQLMTQLATQSRVRRLCLFSGAFLSIYGALFT